MKLSPVFAAVVMALVPAVSQSQGDVVMKDKDATESALIEALTPQRPFRTRSIRISPDNDAGAAPVKRAAASMLITFETNSAELKPQSKKLLDNLGRAMQSDKLLNFKFAIEGHADPRGGEQVNLELSQKRAEMVVAYLADTHRIDPSRLRAVGKGQSEPLNVSQPDAAENRRVTVKTIVE
ncbi:OmpA family protein [Ramlibacter sp. WS9]|uniref:OmpA family protein n=1 Tax=Ramlibacter sp. WS9 TaxID=1882741 RepID=UPI001142C0D6|nr:OmpA family protein [Ramlibacter sp. WS9]ROZ78321.1 OmpA family protein [Ramlibacter sp. WS9]